MPTIIANDAIVLPHPPQVIYHVLTNVQRYREWWPESVRIDRIRPTEQVMGTRFWLYPAGRLGFECQLESLRPPEEIRVRYRSGIVRGQAVWRLVPEADGTHVSYGVHLHTAHWLISLAGRFTDLSAKHSANFQLVLEGLRQHLATDA